MGVEQLIVVGLDGSEGGRRALAWAARHAAASGATVQVVTAYEGGGPRAEEQRQAESMQQWEIDTCTDLDQGRVAVAREVVEGDAVAALTHAARKADLLVLGTHGRSHLRTALLGSVSEACIRQGDCPVVVVPVLKPPQPGEIVQQRDSADAAQHA